MIKLCMFQRLYGNFELKKKNDVNFIIDKISDYNEKRPYFANNDIHFNDAILFKNEIYFAILKLIEKYNFNTSILANNYKSLSITKSHIHDCSEYNPTTNTIKICSMDDISHEVIHLCNTFYDSKNNVIISGFNYYSDGLKFGMPFTEGFTEMINQNTFNKNNNDFYYVILIKYAKLFKNAFNFINIHDYFFRADLDGLLLKLQKYGINKEDIVSYIYLLGKFNLFNFNYIEDYLKDYVNFFNEKLKKYQTK